MGQMNELLAATPANLPATGDVSGWIEHFVHATTLEDRLKAIHQMAGRRLESYEASDIWLHLMHKLDGRLEGEQTLSLVRQYICLAPERPQAKRFYASLMKTDTASPQPRLLFLITSCVPYLKTARRVLNDLQARGAEGVIVIGDPSLAVARVDTDGIVHLPVEDGYEALTSKVLEGMAFLRHQHGQVAIAKLDDDIEFSATFDPQKLREVAVTQEYVGNILSHLCDRYWHLGKTRQPVPVYTRRFRSPFAAGATYLLGSRAVDFIVREWVFYPGEFQGQIYEDRAVGEKLAEGGFGVVQMSHAQMGIVVDHGQRYLAPIV